MLNQGYAYRTVIGGEHHGQTVLSHLVDVYSHSPLEAWRQSLHDGEVTLDGVSVSGEETLRAGQVLVWNRPPWNEPDAPLEFEVLYEDPHLLAVNKPSGLPTLPGGGFSEHTLLRCVQQQFRDANPVHRLGRGTSGIVLFARTADAAARLSASWNTDKVRKIYRALAQGLAAQEVYDINTPIGAVPHPRIGSVWASNPAGKRSRSVARVWKRAADTTVFEVELYSGRPHQIRIHLASIGHPLVGDPLYGAGGQPLAELPGLPGDGGYFLHAQHLQFEHPVTREAIYLEASLPAAFDVTR
jgi:23S rRNA pseudouridine1911/1915/1917 synthase